jgi:hypothetical protein
MILAIRQTIFYRSGTFIRKRTLKRDSFPERGAYIEVSVLCRNPFCVDNTDIRITGEQAAKSLSCPRLTIDCRFAMLLPFPESNNRLELCEIRSAPMASIAHHPEKRYRPKWKDQGRCPERALHSGCGDIQCNSLIQTNPKLFAEGWAGADTGIWNASPQRKT